MPARGRRRSPSSDTKFHSKRFASKSAKVAINCSPYFLAQRSRSASAKTWRSIAAGSSKQKYLPQVEALPGVRELFLRLKRDGKQIALASSAKEDEVKTYKRIAHIEDLVEEESSSDDADRSKPHPDIFEAVLDRLNGIQASEAVAVGDSPYDAIAAGKIGIASIAVLSGGFAEEDLRAAGYSEVYRDCADILAHYEQSLLANKRAA